MNCIGNLPKKIVLNELNFLVTVILLKTGDCILSFRCIRLLSEFPSSYVVQRIRWIFLYIFVFDAFCPFCVPLMSCHSNL